MQQNRISPPSPPSPTNNGFDNYYREFASALQQQQEGNPSNVEELQTQCSDLLRLMALEARTTECPDTKFERLERVKIYKFQFEAIRNQHDKEFLMGEKATSMLQAKERLERAETRAAQQNELLERARRSLAETEETGASIMGELHTNRETIESAQGRVDELNTMADKASKIVKYLSTPWWRRWSVRR